MGSAVDKRLPRLLMLLGICVMLVACDSRSDAASVAAGPSPVPTTPAAPAVASAAPSKAAFPAPSKPKISKAGLAYFFAIALGTEFGSAVKVVTMWDKREVTVRVHGGAAQSRSCLSKVISDFNAITEMTDLNLTTTAADIELYFAPVSKFRSIEPRYVAGNDEFFYMNWADTYAITGATVLIRSAGIRENVRCHLIREELTQAMGLARDSDRYPNSTFYGRYSAIPTQYSPLDEEIIGLLYSGSVHPGDDKKTITRMVTVK